LNSLRVCQKLGESQTCPAQELQLPAADSFSVSVLFENADSGAKVTFYLRDGNNPESDPIQSAGPVYPKGKNGVAFAVFHAKNGQPLAAGRYQVDALIEDSNGRAEANVQFSFGQLDGANNKQSAGSEALTFIVEPNTRNKKMSEFVAAHPGLLGFKDRINKDMKSLNIPVTFKSCGKVNCWYDLSTKAISMCYEFLEYIVEILSEKQAAAAALQDAMNAFVFTRGHEYDHGIIDLHKLPITGGGEDAADEFAAPKFISAGQEGVVFDAAKLFFDLGRSPQSQVVKFFGQHGPSEVRSGNMLCLLYGSNPKKFASFVTNNLVLRSRAPHCQNDYQERVRAWDQILRPISRDPG
jgi:hypothetical protein